MHRFNLHKFPLDYILLHHQSVVTRKIFLPRTHNVLKAVTFVRNIQSQICTDWDIDQIFIGISVSSLMYHKLFAWHHYTPAPQDGALTTDSGSGLSHHPGPGSLGSAARWPGGPGPGHRSEHAIISVCSPYCPLSSRCGQSVSYEHTLAIGRGGANLWNLCRY